MSHVASPGVPFGEALGSQPLLRNDSSDISHLVSTCSAHSNSSKKNLPLQKSRSLQVLQCTADFWTSSPSVAETSHPLNDSPFSPQKQRGTRKLREVVNVSISSVVGMISQVIYVQTHQIVHIKYVQFFLYQFYFNKAFLKVKMTVLQKEQFNLYWVYLLIQTNTQTKRTWSLISVSHRSWQNKCY